MLTRIRAARGNAPLLVPLATLADLVAQGIPVDRAVATVLGLARAGAPDADYRSAAGLATRGAASAPGARGAPPAASGPPAAAHGGRPTTPGRPR